MNRRWMFASADRETDERVVALRWAWGHALLCVASVWMAVVRAKGGLGYWWVDVLAALGFARLAYARYADYRRLSRLPPARFDAESEVPESPG